MPVITPDQSKSLFDAAVTLKDLWTDGYIDMPLNELAVLLMNIRMTYENTEKRED